MAERISAALAQLDDETSDDSSERKNAKRDTEDFRPILADFRLHRSAIDPIIPRAGCAIPRTVIMAQAAVEFRTTLRLMS